MPKWTRAGSRSRFSRRPSPGSNTHGRPRGARRSRLQRAHRGGDRPAHPDRFAGFAALPTADPDESARELARAVGELGLCGAMVNGRTLERFLDDQFFWPIFESAEALGVPLYLHPTPPPRAVYDATTRGSGTRSASSRRRRLRLACRDGLHALRLMLAGVFDRFPALAVIVGHMGEVLPFMIARASGGLGGGAARDGSPRGRSCRPASTSGAPSTSRQAGCSPTRRCAAPSTWWGRRGSSSPLTIRSVTTPPAGASFTQRRSATRNARRSPTRMRTGCSASQRASRIF